MLKHENWYSQEGKIWGGVREGPERCSPHRPEWALGLVSSRSKGRPGVARMMGLQGNHQNLTIRNNCFLLSIYTNVFIFVFL